MTARHWWQRPSLWEDDEEITDSINRPTEAAALANIRRSTGSFTRSEKKRARQRLAAELLTQLLHAQKDMKPPKP